MHDLSPTLNVPHVSVGPLGTREDPGNSFPVLCVQLEAMRSDVVGDVPGVPHSDEHAGDAREVQEIPLSDVRDGDTVFLLAAGQQQQQHTHKLSHCTPQQPTETDGARRTRTCLEVERKRTTAHPFQPLPSPLAPARTPSTLRCPPQSPSLLLYYLGDGIEDLEQLLHVVPATGPCRRAHVHLHGEAPILHDLSGRRGLTQVCITQ